MPKDPNANYQSRDLLQRAKLQRKLPTPAEEALWTLVRGEAFVGFRFRRQHVIGPYIADFYCHRARLIVEIDGGIHEEAGQAEYDSDREEKLRYLGITFCVFGMRRF